MTRDVSNERTQMNPIVDYGAWLSPNISPELKALKPFFDTLPQIHSEYIAGEIKDPKHTKSWTDCSFWYRERTQIGLLSAAVWRVSGTALEEFVTKKGASSGRGDLWIRVRKSLSEYGDGYWCEAKYGCIYLEDGDIKSVLNKVDVRLELAIKDFNKIPSDYKQRLAIAFCELRIKSSREPVGREYLASLLHFLNKQFTASDHDEFVADAYFWIGKKDGWRPNWDSYSHFEILMAVKYWTHSGGRAH